LKNLFKKIGEVPRLLRLLRKKRRKTGQGEEGRATRGTRDLLEEGHILRNNKYYGKKKG